MMRRISVANIILVHHKLIDQTGGSHGVRDINLVDSAISRAFATFDGNDLYEKTDDKIAVTTFGLVNNHGFIDGNKRVGIAVMLLLLKLNGYTLQCHGSPPPFKSGLLMKPRISWLFCFCT